MNRTAELDRRLPQKGSETGLAGKDQAVVMRRLEKQDMKVTLSRTGRQEANIESRARFRSTKFLTGRIHALLAHDEGSGTQMRYRGVRGRGSTAPK